MPSTTAPAGSVTQALDLVTISFKDCQGKSRRKTYRMGGPRARVLKQGKAWFNILLGKAAGALVELPEAEENVLEARIDSIHR